MRQLAKKQLIWNQKDITIQQKKNCYNFFHIKLHVAVILESHATSTILQSKKMKRSQTNNRWQTFYQKFFFRTHDSSIAAQNYSNSLESLKLLKILFVRIFHFSFCNHNSPNWRGIHVGYCSTPGRWRPLKFCSKSLHKIQSLLRIIFSPKLFILFDFSAAKNDLHSQSYFSMKFGKKKKKKLHI